MNEALKRFGSELQRFYRESLLRPMDWRMIDTFARLEEAGEKPEGEDAHSLGRPVDGVPSEADRGAKKLDPPKK